MAKWAKAMFWVAFAQAVLSVAGILFIWRNLVLTRRSVDAAGRANKAAEESVAVAQDTAKRELRAYVNCKGARILNFEGDEPFARVEFQNFGQTPAYEATTVVEAKYSIEPINEALQTTGAPKNFGVIGPNSHIETGRYFRDPPLTAEQKTAIKNGAAHLYVYGQMAYKDTFDEPRITRFQLVIGGKGPVSPDYDLLICEAGNGSD